jgi:uncharacterized repeat protein (TIGR01451 family)
MALPGNDVVDESYRSWLAMIPGVGQRKATALAERFPTLEALRAATREDIEGIEGFGPVLARRVKEFAERSGDRPDYWYRKEASLYLCPSCGKLIAQAVANCPFCGTELEGEQTVAPEVEIPELEDTPRTDVLQPLGQSLNLCPGCGAFVGKDLAVCPSCGTALAGEVLAEEGEGVAAAASADVLQKEGQGLYLCPSCSALVSQDASVCPKCGSAVEGEEAGPAAAEPLDALPPEATSGEGSLFICTNCGAFLRPQDTKCPSCGVEFEEGEVAAESLVAEKEEEVAFFPICPNCGALIPSSLKRCAICGHRRGEPVGKPVEEKVEEPGITKDFLERWRRISEERAETPIQKLERELQQYDDILAADPTLERTWMKKIGILLRLSRVADAVASYEKLADLRPDREEDYRLQVLSVLRAQGDMSMLPRRWSQVAATEPAREIAAPTPKAPPAATRAKVAAPEAVQAVEDAKVVEALAHYDRLLSIDPGLVAAWQTKAELLGRLGRTAEARRALRRADELQRPRDGTSGLRSVSPRVGPHMEGRVNGTKGRTNGRTNGAGRINGTKGRTNGRTNGAGRINGTKGRTNGKVNGMGRINGTRVNGGRVNGLVSPAGRTNGMMSGVAPGEGMVNGLVNGNGFTNGRRGRWTPPKAGTPRDWMRSVTGIAAAVLLLLMIPIFATLLSTSPPGGITIDGLFGDWAGVPAYEDDAADQVVNPDVNMISFRMRAADEAVLVYARVSGVAFQASAGGGDSLYAFVDEDGDAATGFRIGALGAERAVEIFGWDRMVMGTSVWEYDPTRAGTSSDDWRAFDLFGGGAAANGVSEIEARIDVGPAYQPSRSRVLLQTLDRAGNGDPADGVVGGQTGALAVTQRTIAADVVSGTAIPFLSIALKPLAPPIAIASLTVEKLGSYPGAGLGGRLFLDMDANGVVDATDPLVASSSFTPAASFPIGRTLERAESYLFVADLPTPAPNASIGFQVLSVSPVRGADVPVTMRNADITLAYLEGAPGNVTVDGAFADWAPYAFRPDGDDDVRTVGGNPTVNDNIDLRATEAVVAANVSLYMRVDGRILGGVDIPNFRDRPPVVSFTADADGDSVPDAVEEALGPLLPLDFNNDNVSDADQFDDVDQDGVLDYNKCPGTDCTAYMDYVLETTIPAWYPPPYGGSDTRRYVGPISLPPQRGVDTALVYVDRDNRTDTGLLVDVNGSPYGFDYAYQAVGRGGVILESGLFAHNGSRAIPWERVADAPTAIDSSRLEASLDSAVLNLSANHTLIFYTTDWRFGFDTALGGSAIRRAPGLGTRSPGGNGVVINEISPRPNPEWAELANPGPTSVNLNGWTLQRRFGSFWLTIYTYTQTIGAWGSGSEYLSVDLPTNSLPNGGGSVRLRAANATVIDLTTYSGMALGTTWSRFKHATTGKPVDTDTDANDFYVDATPTQGGPNTRHRPRVTVAKIANRASAAPGDLITYTVYYNNTDTGRANDVWVNDTLPNDVAFQGSSVPFDSTDGKVYRWVFAGVNPLTANSFSLTVRVNATAGDGQVLRNTAGLNYTDQLNRRQTASIATASTTVTRPVIVVSKIVDKSTALPGDTLTYTVYYNNTGSAVANHVWVNDTLPVGVTFQGASPAPDSIVGQNLSWHFTNVGVGANSLTITVTVDISPPNVLVNWAFLNYTAQNDFPLGSSSDSAATVIPEFETVAAPLAILFLGYALHRRTRRKKEG